MNITRYIKINYVLMKNSLIRDWHLPGLVLTNILFRILELIISIVFFRVIFANVTTLAGWNFYQVLFLYLFARIIMVTHSGWTKKGVQSMATDLIRRGEFDFYLAKPVDSMFMVSIKSPRIYSFITLFYLIPFAIYAATKTGIEIGIDNILWFFVLGLLAFILYYFLSILVITPAFWFIRLWTIGDTMDRLGSFMRYPAGIFSQTIKIVLMVIFPIITISYIPAEILFNPPSGRNIIFMFLITIIFALITRLIWRLGEKGYNSASS